MSFLSYFYKKTIKHDLINKFKYNKTIHIPKIKKITLDFNSKNTKLKNLSSSLLAIEIIALKKGSFTLAKKANIVIKIRKGNPVGCKVILRKNRMFNFLENNILDIIPKLKYSNSLYLSHNKMNKNVLSYNITNLFIFNELEKNYYLFNELKKLNVIIITNSKKTIETIFLAKSLHF